MGKKGARILTTGLTLAIMILIFCFSSQPAESSDSTSGILAVKIANFFQPGWQSLEFHRRQAYYDRINYLVRKVAHFTEFALLGFSLRLCLESWIEKRIGLGAATWAGATLYAALDEFHQIRVAGRSGQVTDVMLDSCGVLMGVLLAWLGILLIRLLEDRYGSVPQAER